MSKFLDKPSSGTLYKAIAALQNEEECRRFLEDLCTVSELKAMEQRMDVAMLLDDGLIYSEILEMYMTSNLCKDLHTIGSMNHYSKY